MPIEIVPASEPYVEGFHCCLDGVAREKKYLIFQEAPPLERMREFVLGNIRNDVPQFFAVEDGIVVGWCDITTPPYCALAHSGSLGMGLDKEHRMQGIGRRLLSATLDKAKANGLERIELGVYTANAPAIRLYESFGFTREGMKRHHVKIDGAFFDSILMALFFDQPG